MYKTDKEEYLRGDASVGDSRQTRAVFVWESDGGELHLEILDIAKLEKNLDQSNEVLERIMTDSTSVQSLPIQNLRTDSPLLVCLANHFNFLSFYLFFFWILSYYLF